MMTRSSCGIDARHERRRRRRRLQSSRLGAAERMLADEQLVQHEPERVDVGPLRQRRPGRPLLGRHVARRAGQHVQPGVRAQNRDAEIGDAHVSVVVDQDVGRA